MKRNVMTFLLAFVVLAAVLCGCTDKGQSSNEEVYEEVSASDSAEAIVVP